MIFPLLATIALSVAFSQNLDRLLFEFETQLQKYGLRYKKKKDADEVVYAHRNVTLRVQFNHRVHFMSAWIVPRRDYRDNKQTLDFLSHAVKTFCMADEKQITDFRDRVAYSISHTKSTSLTVGKCSGELRHVAEFMNWELILNVRE